MNLKEKALEISKQLQNLVIDSQNNKKIQATIELSDDQAIILQIIKIFVKAASDGQEINDNDIINMIFIKGLIYELERMKNTKKEIYDMGNLEIMAIENNVNLSEEEKKVASIDISLPKTIDEYWELGYNTIKCPYCKQRAVWKSTTKDFHCINGCRKSGFIEQYDDD